MTRQPAHTISREGQQFQLLGRVINPIFAWPLAAVVFSGVLWSVTEAKLDQAEDAIRKSSEARADSLSKMHAERLARAAEQLDQITLSIKYYWETSHHGLRLDDQYRYGLYPRSDKLYVSIFDRNGALVTSTAGRPFLLDYSERSWFKAHKAAQNQGLLIVKPDFSPRLEKTLIRFTRRLNTPAGEFDGVVSLALEPEYLASITDESRMEKSSYFSVAHRDGTPLSLRVGHAAASTASLFHAQPVFLSDSGTVLYPSDNFLDKKSRIVAWHALQAYPLVASVGLSEQEIFASHDKMARDYRNMAAAGTVLLFLFAVTGMAFSSRLAWRKHQAEEVKNTYRLATDSAREGFYMVRAVYGEQRRILDFQVEDCNERGATYYGTTRRQLIGAKFRDFMPPSDYLEEVLNIFRRAMETGFYEDEFKVSPESPLEATWVHRRLVRSGHGLAVTLRDISEAKAHEEALSQLANADSVTTLPNRHWLMHYLPTALQKAADSNTMVALLFVDLDDFKNINDTLGHAAGDALLQAAALRLKSVIRPGDNVARLGGDEFTIILERIEGEDDVRPVALRVIKTLSEPFVLGDGNSHTVRGSIGISLYPHDGRDGPTLLKHADIAMYTAKSAGKATYRFFLPEFAENLMQRLNSETALRKAIDLDEFVLHYQPRVDTFSGELRGMEALVRWMHPERGIVGPQEFIPIAEQTGLIVRLGEMVIEKACAQLAQWRKQGLPVVPVSVNVSALQLIHGRIAQRLASCMNRHDIDSSLLEVEITESCMIGEDGNTIRELETLEHMGIKLLVDDFGTGYSSLSQLQRLDLDILKIDREFTARLCNGKDGDMFFMAILSMAHVLGMTVVAEGVETEEQLRVLQALSCNEIQGYYVSRPVPADDMPALMLRRFLFPSSRPVLHVV